MTGGEALGEVPSTKPMNSSAAPGRGGAQLRASTLVVVRDRNIAFFGTAGRMTVELDVHATLPTNVGRSLTDLELASCLHMQDAVELWKGLDKLQLSEPIELQGPLPALLRSSDVRLVPLGDVLMSMEAGRPVTGILAFTAGEALWTGCDAMLAELAIELFIAQMPDWARRASYGCALSRDGTRIHGDMPIVDDLRWAAAQIPSDAGYPFVLDMQRRCCTGDLASERAVLDPASGRLAVAEEVTMITHGNGPGTVTYVYARAGDPMSLSDPFQDRPLERTPVSGGDPDSGLARLKCFSEAAEFLTSGTRPGIQTVLSSAGDLEGMWLSPEDVISYTPSHRERLQVRKFDVSEPQLWVLGERAGERIWLPAALVFSRIPDPPSWFHPSAMSSSGVAAHSHLQSAVGSAWLEIVERDAFQRFRLLRHLAPPAQIDPATMPAAEREILRTLANRAEVMVLVIPSPTRIPVILVRTDTSDRLGIGMAASVDPVDALRHALTEAVGQAADAVWPVLHSEEVRTPSDHGALYSQPFWRARLDWMRAGPTLGFDELTARAIVGGNAGADQDFYGDLPSSAAIYRFRAPVGWPVKVVRVIDPTMIPITFGYDSDPDGRPDVLELCRQAGHRPGAPLDPHPLA